jgi:hypothetical protein
MARFHTLSTTPNEGPAHASAVPITRLDVCIARANAAGDAALCKSQTIEVREGVPTSYKIVARMTRISKEGRWGAWEDRPLAWYDLA